MSDEKTLAEAGEELKEAASGAAQAGKAAVAEKVNAARDAAREKIHGIKEGAKVRYEKAGDVARERYQQVSDSVRHGYQRARKNADDLAHNVNEYVRDNPGKSVAIAAGVGFLVGLLLRGRSHRD
jgi:ElaB/YqjD/DUF883 family membrane-anchored ribosome-binding protein